MISMAKKSSGAVENCRTMGQGKDLAPRTCQIGLLIWLQNLPSAPAPSPHRPERQIGPSSWVLFPLSPSVCSRCVQMVIVIPVRSLCND